MTAARHESRTEAGRPCPAEAYRGKNVLITGGLGFIGSNLAVRLAHAGARVTIVDSLAEGCGANRFNIAAVESGVNLIEADIGEAAGFGEELREAETIFNLAGEISHARSMREPERDLCLNTTAQLRFLLACREFRPKARIVYAGTRQVYGRPSALPVEEEHAIRPVDFNGIHKHAAAQYHMLLTDRGELDAVVLRLSNVYGPRMALHLPQQGFLGVYLRQALEGLPLAVYGAGRQLRDPVHVDDVVDAFLLAGTVRPLRSRVFNIGGTEALALREIAVSIAGCSRGSGIREVPFPPELERMDIGSYYSGTQRARRELGWSAQVGFGQGVERTLSWYSRYAAHYEVGPRTEQRCATGVR